MAQDRPHGWSGCGASELLFITGVHELELPQDYDRHVAVLTSIAGREPFAGLALILYGYLDRGGRLCPQLPTRSRKDGCARKSQHVPWRLNNADENHWEASTRTTDREAAAIHTAL